MTISTRAPRRATSLPAVVVAMAVLGLTVVGASSSTGRPPTDGSSGHPTGASVASSPAGQPTAGRPLALRDYYDIQTVADPAISPDGRLVAFVRSRIIEDENRRHREIWIVPSDGSEPPARLTGPSASASDPQWSPDGALLAFASTRSVAGEDADDEGAPWFLRMDRPAGEAFRIPGVGGTPVFSPDGRWIAFTRPTPPPTEPAMLDDWERLLAERFTGRIYDWMNYRFNGRGYLSDPRDPAATPPRELYVVPREGGEPRRLTTLGVDVRSVAWRPDGGAMAIVADEHQRDEHTYGRADVWIVDLDGGLTRLTDDRYDNTSPAWAPDGESLVVRRQLGLDAVIEARQGRGAPIDLVLMPVAGGSPRNLTAAWDLQPGAPTWGPEGTTVRFEASVGGNRHLFAARASGDGVDQLTEGDRRVGGVSLSAAGDRMAYTSTDARRPAELCAARSDGSGEVELTRVNSSLLDEVELRPADRIGFSSQDGTPIEGWVMTPPGYDPAAAGRYPLILAIHGGPHGAYGNTFSFQFQLWAANGYVVLYTNPRGSTGYGEDFLWATWGGWGVLDYQDVMAGVDHTLERYAIDQDRMGVTGYSYGGFMTNWVIGQTDRFAAAVSGAGISNWVSDYGTADIPRTKESEFYGPPWEPESRELLMRLSPITHVGSASTPTLFVHGEADHRVPIEEAEQMYTALQKLRVPATFIRYPGMAHGGWTPWNTVHRYHHELEWWARYLASAHGSTQQ